MTVKQIQSLLLYLGYYSLAIDGIAGSGTTAAVKSFQADTGLDVDGIAGAKTQAALRAAVYWDEQNPENTVENSDFWGEIQYFRPSEFACKCGGKYCDGYPAEPQEKLVRIAEEMRAHFGKPVNISSGLRCAQHNANVGGVANSRHLSGKAMDFRVTGFTAAQVLAWTQARSDLRYSYAIDSNYVHMDIE